MAILKAADLTRRELHTLLAGLKLSTTDPGSLRIWAEAPDGWTLDYWRGPTLEVAWCGAGRKPGSVIARACVDQACAGRVFAPSGELRWRVIESLGEKCCRVVFLGRED